MSHLTFADAVDLHRTHLRAKRRAPRTLEWYAEQLAAFDTWRRTQHLPDSLPGADTIELYLATLHAQTQPQLKPSTVNARFRALHALFMFLEKRKRLHHDENPMYDLEAPSVPKEARRHVTPDDFARLLAAFTAPDANRAFSGNAWLTPRDQLILHILFYSGLRVSELCALTIHDIHRDEQAILVRCGKGEKARTVPSTPETVNLFVRYLFLRPAHVDRLLLSSDGYTGVTGPLTPEGVRQMLIRRCRQAAINPPYTPHQFRHGFAMWFLNSGARLTTVSVAMGHSSPDITHRIYAHTTPVTVRDEYEQALARTQSRP